MPAILLNTIGTLNVILAGVLVHGGAGPLGFGYFFIGMAMYCFARM